MIILPDIKNYKEIYPFRNGQGISPQTRLIAFCMKFTGIEKLFPQNNVREFLVRLPLAFRKSIVIELYCSPEHQLEFNYQGKTRKINAKALAKQTGMIPSEARYFDVISNYESNGCLIEFEYEGMKMTLTADDISRHIGIHLTKFPNEPLQHDKWFAGISDSLKDIRSDSIFTDAMSQYLDPIEDLRKRKYPEDMIFEEELRGVTESKDETIDMTLLFAEKVMSSIPEHLFEEFRMNNLPLVANLERHKNAKDRPVMSFDWNDFTSDMQNNILKLMFPDDYYEGLTLEELEEKQYHSVEGLIYLSWLYANDFVWDGGEDMVVDPGYNFGLWYLEKGENDEGLSSRLTADWYFREYKMETVAVLLKGITGKGETRLRNRCENGEFKNDSQPTDDNSDSGSSFKENGDEDELTDLPF
jgi:hypothetical protein